jgi:hypothetical protein
MVLKFLGIGKKSEFYLEAPPADPAADSQPAAKAKLAEPTPAAAAPEPAHLEAVAAVESNGKKPALSGKTLQEAKAEKKAKTEKTEVKPAPAAPPAPKAEPVSTNFATTFQPNATPRRRPGPSMNIFKDMAKQVNPKK